jgi:O-antigen/teichoic acid export membrane protein
MGAFAASISATVAVQLIGLGTGILLARSFDPTTRGELAAVLLWPMLMGVVGTLGLFESVTYHTARARQALGSIVGSSAVVAVLQGVLFCGLTALLLPLVLHRQEHHVLSTAYTFLPYVPLTILTMTFAGILNGLHRDRAFQAMRVLVVGASAALLTVFAIFGDLSIQDAIWAYLAAEVITWVSCMLLVGQERLGSLRASARVARPLVRYGLLSHSGSVSAQLNQRLDLLVISIFLSARDLGLYTIAFTLTTGVFVIGWSVAYVVLPRIAAADRPRQAELARRTVSLTLWASSLVALPALFLMPEMIKLIFGSAYSPATDLARILLVAAIALSAARALEAVLRGLGRPFEAGLAEIVSLAVTVIGLAILLPAIGLTGAAVASLLAYSTSMAMMIVRTRKALGVSLRSILIPTADDLRLVAASIPLAPVQWR